MPRHDLNLDPRGENTRMCAVLLLVYVDGDVGANSLLDFPAFELDRPSYGRGKILLQELFVGLLCDKLLS